MSEDYYQLIKQVFDDVMMEVQRARVKHPGHYKNGHEAYAILLEEIDELWQEIKSDAINVSPKRVKAEAVQVMAVAMRFIIEVIGRKTGEYNP